MEPQIYTVVKANDLVSRYALGHLWLFSTRLEQEPDLLVRLYDSDVVLDSLDLDFSESLDDSVDVHVFTANLTVNHAIHNQNTDGATSLIVLGNLHAKNIAIGGQECYVRGNLQVDEVLCGSYNHGEMTVDGDVSAKLLVSDDYSFWIKGKIDAPIAATECERIGALEGRRYDPNFDSEDDASGIGYGGARWLDGNVPVGGTLSEDCLDEDEDSSFCFSMLESIVRDGRSALTPEFSSHPPDRAKLERVVLYQRQFKEALEEGELELATKLHEQLSEMGLPALPGHYDIAIAAYDLDENAQAIFHFSACIDAAYQEAECRVKRASSLIDLDDANCQEGWDDCQWVIENSESYDHEWLASAYNIQGVSLRIRKMYEEAIPYFHKALAENDEYANAFAGLTRCLYMLGREEEALSYAKLAVAADDEPGFLLYIKAKCHATMGELDEALADFLTYAEYDSEHIYTWLSLAEIYISKGIKQEARKAIQRALKIDSKNEKANEMLMQIK